MQVSVYIHLRHANQNQYHIMQLRQPDYSMTHTVLGRDWLRYIFIVISRDSRQQECLLTSLERLQFNQ